MTASTVFALGTLTTFFTSLIFVLDAVVVPTSTVVSVTTRPKSCFKDAFSRLRSLINAFSDTGRIGST